MELPRTVQEIADVIGRERALFLIGQLPKCTSRDPRYPAAIKQHVILYVPKRLKPDDLLVKILGWNDASKLVSYFGGEILQPGTCAEIYRNFLRNSARRMHADGVQAKEIAELLELSERTVKRYCADNPQKDIHAANDNTPQRQLAALGQ